MNNRERDDLISEIQELKTMLEVIPENRIIDIESIRSRIQELESNLPDEKKLQWESEKLYLTFKGMPVRDSTAININFAVNALQKFCSAVYTLIAGQNADHELKYNGPIPSKKNHSMLITGIARGSFGFEIELPAPIEDKAENEHENWFPPEIKTKTAVCEIQSILNKATNGTDEDISTELSSINPRAICKIHDFTNYLNQNSAYCDFYIDDQNCFKFESLEKLAIANDKLNPSYTQESTELLVGSFEGELPTSRNFEFKCQKDNYVIRGKISQEIENPKEIDKYLNKRCEVKFFKIRVGKAKPKYTLMSLEDISEIPENLELGFNNESI